jgi:hypothetical protein
MVIGGVVLIAICVLVGSELFGSDGGGESTPPPQPSVRLDSKERRDLEAAVRADPTVRELTGGGKIAAMHVVPWTSQGGGRVLGASIEVKLRKPLDLSSRALPALVTPGPSAPPQTPALHRKALYSAGNVSALRTLVSTASDAVVEVVPAGSRVEITQAHLIGPRPSRAYLGVEGS